MVHRCRDQASRVRGEAHVGEVVGVPLQPPDKLSRREVIQPHHLVVTRQGYQVRITYLSIGAIRVLSIEPITVLSIALKHLRYYIIIDNTYLLLHSRYLLPLV